MWVTDYLLWPKITPIYRIMIFNKLLSLLLLDRNEKKVAKDLMAHENVCKSIIIIICRCMYFKILLYKYVYKLYFGQSDLICKREI